jgi:hypothetical protein
VADAILGMANPSYNAEVAMQTEIYRVAQHIVTAPGLLETFKTRGLKNLLPQALAITRSDYRQIYPPTNLFLTDKADGQRAIAMVYDGKGLIIADTLHTFAPKVVASDNNASYMKTTIADGELVTGAGGVLHFYAFDTIVVADENVSNVGFENRVSRLGEAVELLRDAGVPAAAKVFQHIGGTESSVLEGEFRSMYDRPRSYQIDGLIFVVPGKSYRDTVTYKWKSASDNTIDFLARRAPPSVLGKKPFLDKQGHHLYFLFVGIAPDLFNSLALQRCPGYNDLFGKGENQMDANLGSYFPIQFSPSDAPLAYIYWHPDKSPLGEIDGKVVEGKCAGECATGGGFVDWEMVRIREDRKRELLAKRYYGNDYFSAELIWLNYVDPFPVEQLWEGPSHDYFMQSKSGAYKAQTAFLSFIKTERINALKHAGWVVDIGAGRGQDLGRYLAAEVHHLVAVDNDRAALSELVRRRYSDKFKKQRHVTTVHILVADVTSPYEETLKKLEILGLLRETADALVCNLAVHYFLGSPEGLRNFVVLVRNIVRIKGTVTITFLRGDAVHELFRKEGVTEGKSWEYRENEAVKYSLTRLYKSDELEMAGQRIGVLLPFSSGQTYTEFLVNPDALAREFKNHGFTILSEQGAEKSLPDFRVRNKFMAKRLTPGDIQWVSLYGELLLQKGAKPPSTPKGSAYADNPKGSEPPSTPRARLGASKLRPD